MTHEAHVKAARRGGDAGRIEAWWAGIAARKEGIRDCPFAEPDLARRWDEGRTMAANQERRRGTVAAHSMPPEALLF